MSFVLFNVFWKNGLRIGGVEFAFYKCVICSYKLINCNFQLSIFLSCECNKRITETPICICRRIMSFLRCFRFRAAFGSPQNALSERTSTLGGFGLSLRHIRSITKIGLHRATLDVRKMCVDNAEIAFPSSVSRHSQIFMTRHNCTKCGNQVQNMRFRNQKSHQLM